MFRKAIAIFLVFVLSWGNTGFCLNVHYCETSEAISVMVNHFFGEKCGEGSTSQFASCEFDEIKSCCQKLTETLPSNKKDCCSDTEFELKISDAFQGSFHQLQIQKQLGQIIWVPLDNCFCHNAAHPVILWETDNKPPDIPEEILCSGQNILIQNCVYRI